MGYLQYGSYNENCPKHHFPVIEDCCQAYFTPYKGKWVGTEGIEYASGLCPVTKEELKSIGTLRIYET